MICLLGDFVDELVDVYVLVGKDINCVLVGNFDLLWWLMFDNKVVILLVVYFIYIGDVVMGVVVVE